MRRCGSRRQSAPSAGAANRRPGAEPQLQSCPRFCLPGRARLCLRRTLEPHSLPILDVCGWKSGIRMYAMKPYMRNHIDPSKSAQTHINTSLTKHHHGTAHKIVITGLSRTSPELGSADTPADPLNPSQTASSHYTIARPQLPASPAGRQCSVHSGTSNDQLPTP